MAKPTTEMKLRREYTDRGYTPDSKKYICPVCDTNLRKLKGNNVRTNPPNLWKNVVVCVLIFRKDGYPSIAACPKCGLRRSDKHTMSDSSDRCQGVKKDGTQCTRPAGENGMCYQHQGQTKRASIPNGI